MARREDKQMCAGEKAEFASRVLDGLLAAFTAAAVIGLASLLLACGGSFPPTTAALTGGGLNGMVELEHNGETIILDLSTGLVMGDAAAHTTVKRYLIEVMLDANADGTPYHLALGATGERAESGDLVTCLIGELSRPDTAVRGSAPISSACPAASVEIAYTQPEGSGTD